MKNRTQSITNLPNADSASRLVGKQKAKRPVPNPEFAVLDQFATHNLNELNNATLMDRVDTKYVIPRVLVVDLLESLKDTFTVLEIKGRRRFHYLNTYYDYADYHHYLSHHNGKINRYKVRQRTYIDTNTSFLEIKYKNNKKRTRKTRMLVDAEHSNQSQNIKQFLHENGLHNIESLQPTQSGSYYRIALANEQRGERISVDSGLQFYDLALNTKHALGPWVVIEVKQAEFDRTSPFFNWAKRHGLRKAKFSKYCMGVYFTGPNHLKRNRFHEVARRLQTRRLAQHVH